MSVREVVLLDMAGMVELQTNPMRRNLDKYANVTQVRARESLKNVKVGYFM